MWLFFGPAPAEVCFDVQTCDDFGYFKSLLYSSTCLNNILPNMHNTQYVKYKTRTLVALVRTLRNSLFYCEAFYNSIFFNILLLNRQFLKLTYVLFSQSTQKTKEARKLHIETGLLTQYVVDIS